MSTVDPDVFAMRPPPMSSPSSASFERPSPRHDWRLEELRALHDLPLTELLYRAQAVHRQVFPPGRIQLCTLLSIKTGGCPEDCAYCPQSAHHPSGKQAEPILELETVLEQASLAKAAGATRFCMGAAWRGPRDRDLAPVLAMVAGVKSLGLETCVTLGMLTAGQARRLKQAGLDFYNHNLDTSPEFYGEIISTRTYADRLETLRHVRGAGIKVCCGGIVGMGESVADRLRLVQQLANLPEHPESVPINALVQVAGTRVYGLPACDPLSFVRVVALARLAMPRSYVRLSAGRSQMSDETQALCFMAGANSIFHGETLLTTPNPEPGRDRALLERLGLHSETGAADT